MFYFWVLLAFAFIGLCTCVYFLFKFIDWVESRIIKRADDRWLKTPTGVAMDALRQRGKEFTEP